MKNKILLTSLLAFIVLQNLMSQNICDFDDNFSSFTQIDWDALENEEVLYRDWVADCNGCVGNATIPTVVHVFYTNEQEIVDAATIQLAIDKINSDLSGGLGGFDTGIQLELAMIDDHGNCTSGIEYVPVTEDLVFASSNDHEWKPLSIYDTDHYLNIWICNFTGNASTTNGELSQFPQTSDFDGITIKRETFLNTLDAGHEFEEAMTHEVGHYFGLFHVWGTNNAGSTCAQGCHSNAQHLTRGDRVEDTNRCFSATPYSDCDDLQQCFTCDNSIQENYPKENFMSYARFCKSEFTEGQAVRMWWFLNQFRDLLNTNQNQICSGTSLVKLGHNIEVTGNESWTTSNLPNNGTVVITGDLTIKQGAELNIHNGVELHFCTAGRMIIERGATVINAGRLTNACGDQWQGVTVYGTTNAPAGNYFGHPDQGLFVSNQGSKIENAVVGVTCSGPNFLNDSGGLFYASGVEFLDNSTSVLIPTYFSFANYPASFTDCSFSSDGQYPFSSFIELINVKGVRVDGCDFMYSGPSYGTGIEGYGYGIWAKSSGILMESSSITDKFGNTTGTDRCTFSGLGYGVHITNTLGNKPFEIMHAQFDNCYVGVYDGGMSIGKIIYNNFNLGTVPDPSVIAANDQSQIGLFVQGSLFTIELQENNFLGSGSFPFNMTGVIADNVGSHSNAIRKNTYRDCRVSNLSTRDNGPAGLIIAVGGLQYQCNDLLRSSFFDFTVPQEGVNGIVLNSQINRTQATFDEFGNILSAGNLFSFIDGPNGQFSNQGQEADYHFTEGVFREEPFGFEGLSKVISLPASCAEEFCPPPCDIIVPNTPGPGDLGPFVHGFNEDKDDFNDAYTDYTDGSTTNSEAEQLEAVMTSLTNNMDETTDIALLTLAQDSAGTYYNDYLWWIGQQDSYDADIWLAAEHAANQDWTQANTIINSLPTAYNLQGVDYAEWQAIQSIFAVVQSEGLASISSSSINTLNTIISQQLGNASILANNILYLNGQGESPIYYMPDLSDIRPRSAGAKAEQNLYIVSPNPTSGIFSLAWQNKSIPKVTVTILSISGKVLAIDEISRGESINIKQYPSGMYYLNVSTNGNTSETIKVIKLD